MNEMLLRKNSLGRRLGQVLGVFLVLITVPFFARAEEKQSAPVAPFDIVIKGGTIYDGTGEKPRVADVAIRGDRVAGINFPAERAGTVIDAMARARLINMLSWSTESLIEDGRSQSEIRQGVTTETGRRRIDGPAKERIKSG
jgi:N-acyl-D-amino-acid deacylase